MRSLVFSSQEWHWRFFRAGGFDQVKMDTGADIAHLEHLDQKLWAALSCPTRGLEFDTRTLDLIDTDHDGRIRAPEVIAACKWACALLKEPDVLLKSGEPLELSSINDATPEGKRLLASARQILANLGKGDVHTITAEDTSDSQRIFANTRFNGDGIIPPESADSPVVASVIADIIASQGSEVDRSGRPGVTQAKVDTFFASLAEYKSWHAAMEADRGRIMPLGDATPAAYAAFKAVQAKIDDYFARCLLAAFDARAEAAVNRRQEEYLAIAAKDLTVDAAEIAAFPLAQIRAGRPLPLCGETNPAWSQQLSVFAAAAAGPLAGAANELTEAQWLEVCEKLRAHAEWVAKRPAGVADRLGDARVQEILAGDFHSQITQLIARDKALESESASIADVDRLVCYRRDLYRLLTNYVNFKEFYVRGDFAIFQAGILYLDQRSCELCVRVSDTARHATLAPLSRAYLAYCDCTRRGGTDKMTIAAAFTAGDSDNLMVGRNGVFYDRKGQDWDATITKIVDNPISIRQAFWAPYKRVIRYIEEQIAKRAAAADAAATAGMTTAFSEATGPKPQQAPPKKIDIGVVAALGVAVGAVTTAFGVFLQWLAGVPIYYMPVYVAVVMLLISLPSMVIAALKLRQRNLGPLLDANGWAVNTRAIINIPFGQQLTRRAALPPGSQRDLFDPYAESKKGRYTTLLIAVLVLVLLGAWYFGVIERYVPNLLPKSSYVLRKEAAADAAAAKAKAAQAETAPQPATQPATQPALR